MRIRHLLIITCLLTYSGLYGQHDFRPGYVVINSDTLRGLVDYKLNKNSRKSCLFKADRRSEVREYSVLEADAFGFDTRQFEKIVVDGEPFFARTLAKGSLSLYRLDDVYYVNSKSSDSLVMLRPPVQRIVEVAGNGGEQKRKMVKVDRPYVGPLNYMVVSCGLRADRAGYSAPDLTRVVSAYNECRSDVVALPAAPWITFHPYILGGYVQSKLEIDSLPASVFKPVNYATGGLGFETATPRKFDRISLVFEALYTATTYQGLSTKVIDGAVVFTRRDQITFDVAYLKFPMAFKYNLKGAASTFYVKAGGYLSAHLKDVESKAERETQSAPFGTQKETLTNLNASRNPRGIQFCIGYESRPRARFGFFGELRFEKGAGFVGRTVHSHSTLTNLAVFGGIKF